MKHSLTSTLSPGFPESTSLSCIKILTVCGVPPSGIWSGVSCNFTICLSANLDLPIGTHDKSLIEFHLVTTPKVYFHNKKSTCIDCEPVSLSSWLDIPAFHTLWVHLFDLNQKGRKVNINQMKRLKLGYLQTVLDIIKNSNSKHHLQIIIRYLISENIASSKC